MRRDDGRRALEIPTPPAKPKDVRKLVIEMAMASVGWGDTKIRDALRTGLAIEIGRTTVAEILAARAAWSRRRSGRRGGHGSSSSRRTGTRCAPAISSASMSSAFGERSAAWFSSVSGTIATW